ncbi:MAG: BolA family transcriptional regulator [Deltaproteobacteria bacterium]|nr:BolA family transcriptional regulator [Deltaproteobacteria bacterium]
MLGAAFPGAEITVEDTTGTGNHFQLIVIASEFGGKSRVERHQMVYRALGEAMQGPIHALSLKTYAPREVEEGVKSPLTSFLSPLGRG